MHHTAHCSGAVTGFEVFCEEGCCERSWLVASVSARPHIRNPWKDPFRQMTLTSWVRDIRSSGGSRYVRGPSASPCPASIFTIMSWVCNLCVFLSGNTTGCPKKVPDRIVWGWATLGTFGQVWPLWHFWHSRHFWTFLGTPGTFRHYLALWALLGHLGTLGTLGTLGKFGHSAQMCPMSKKVCESAQSAQKSQECLKVPRVPKYVQKYPECQKCPTWQNCPKVSRVAKP